VGSLENFSALVLNGLNNRQQQRAAGNPSGALEFSMLR